MYLCQGWVWQVGGASWYPGCANTQESHLGNFNVLFSFSPSAPLVHLFSFFNQSSRLRPDPPSPRLPSPHRSFVSNRCLRPLLSGLRPVEKLVLTFSRSSCVPMALRRGMLCTVDAYAVLDAYLKFSGILFVAEVRLGVLSPSRGRRCG